MRISVVWIAGLLISLLALERPAEALRRRGHLTAEMVTQIRNRWTKLEKHALDPKKRDRAEQIMRLAQDFPLGGLIPAPTIRPVKWFLTHEETALVKGTKYLPAERVKALAGQMERLEKGLLDPETHDASRQLIDLIQKYPEGGMVPQHVRDRALGFLKHKKAVLVKGTTYLTQRNLMALVGQVERLKEGLTYSATHDTSQQLLDLIAEYPEGGMVPTYRYQQARRFLKHGDAALVRGTAYLSENKVRALKRQMKRLEARLKNPRTKEASQLLIDLTTKYPHGGIIPWSIYDRALWFLKEDGSQTVSSNPSQNHLLDILLGQRKPTKRLRSEAHQAQ